MASLEKIGTQDVLGQTAYQILHTLCLMSEERFQPRPLTFIYSNREPGMRLNQMAPGDCDDILCD
jgi:hypothetical protein